MLRLKRFFYQVIGFNKSEYGTIMVALEAKKTSRWIWYANNFVWPVSIVYLPFLGTLISQSFDTLYFSKTLLELSLTGTLSMIGVNVIRSAITKNERLDDAKIPEELRKKIHANVDGIKDKLSIIILALSVIGAIFYIIQALQLVVAQKTPAKYWMALFAFISIVSILIARVVTVVYSNFTSNDELIEIWFKQFYKQNDSDYKDLNTKLTKEGLL